MKFNPDQFKQTTEIIPNTETTRVQPDQNPEQKEQGDTFEKIGEDMVELGEEIKNHPPLKRLKEIVKKFGKDMMNLFSIIKKEERKALLGSALVASMFTHGQGIGNINTEQSKNGKEKDTRLEKRIITEEEKKSFEELRRFVVNQIESEMKDIERQKEIAKISKREFVKKNLQKRFLKKRK